jgi:hypothetical protein
MGCHTWFFRKEERSIEEARRLYLEMLDNVIDYWRKMETDASIRDHYGTTLENVRWDIKVMERRYRIVKSGLCNVAVMNRQEGVTSYIPDKGFYITDDTMPHDIFRVGKNSKTDSYFDDELFSMQETINFIEKNKEKVYEYHNNELTKKDWKEQLQDFWDRYPDGMIHFG